MEETIVSKGLLSKMTATSNKEGKACFVKNERKKNRLHSLAVQETSFSTSATLGLLPIVAFREKDFGGRGSCVASGIEIHMFD